MNANELRIGNYTDKGRVEHFYQHGIHVGFGKCFDFGEVNPVPLTEEWLLKFGFSTTVYSELAGYTVKNKYGNYYLCSQYIGREFEFEVIYIHQLQNLYFALTGEELIINDSIISDPS